MAYRIGRRPTAALVVLLIIGTALPGLHAAPRQHAGHVAHRLQDARDGKTDCSAQQTSPPNLCLTTGCVKAAYSLLSTMDTSVDPCDDFYSFACGSFVNRTVIPDDDEGVSQMSILGKELQLDMRQLIDAPIEFEDSPATVKMKTYYISCMDEEGIEQKGLEPMKGALKKMGGWPVLEGAQWNESAFEWIESIYRSRFELGVINSCLFTFDVYEAPEAQQNNSRYILELSEAQFTLSEDTFTKGVNESEIQSYFNYMVDMAVLLGAEPEQAKSQLEDALHFEIQLANMSLAVSAVPAEEQRNMSHPNSEITLDELSRAAPAVPWVTLVQTLPGPAGHTVLGNDTVRVKSVDYFKNLGELLETTPKRVVANYVLWRTIQEEKHMFDKAAREVELKHSGKSASEHQPRRQRCLEETLTRFDVAAASLYVKNHFNEETRKGVSELVADIHQQFNIMLQEVNWIDDATKQKAVEKSEAIEYNVGHPDELLNDTLVAKYYEGWHVSEDGYIQNCINGKAFHENKEFKMLFHDPLDKKNWMLQLMDNAEVEVNAGNQIAANIITFSSGILRGVYYSNDRPKYLNYGSIGSVIGHEIAHGFDDEGHQYDAEGNVRDWWQPESLSKLQERIQCIIEQYGNITVPAVNMTVNGTMTQGENIADAAGMKMARRAYQAYQQRAGREPALPGLQHYSSEQMFWLGHANAWCSVLSPDALRDMLLTNEHPPWSVRVNMSLRNTRQFAEDWQCPSGSRMNPAKRCGVW